MALDEPILVESGSGRRLSLNGLWQKVLNIEAIWAGVPEDGSPVEVTLKAGDHIAERYEVEVDGMLLPVHTIEFVATLPAYPPAMSPAAAAEYSTVGGQDAGRAHARVVRWEAPEGGPVKSLTFVGLLETNANEGVT